MKKVKMVKRKKMGKNLRMKKMEMKMRRKVWKMMMKEKMKKMMKIKVILKKKGKKGIKFESCFAGADGTNENK